MFLLIMYWMSLVACVNALNGQGVGFSAWVSVQGQTMTFVSDPCRVEGKPLDRASHNATLVNPWVDMGNLTWCIMLASVPEDVTIFIQKASPHLPISLVGQYGIVSLPVAYTIANADISHAIANATEVLQSLRFQGPYKAL